MRWVDQGLPHYQARPRAKVLVRPEDVDAFLQKQQVPQMDLDALVEEVMQGLTTKN